MQNNIVSHLTACKTLHYILEIFQKCKHGHTHTQTHTHTHTHRHTHTHTQTHTHTHTHTQTHTHTHTHRHTHTHTHRHTHTHKTHTHTHTHTHTNTHTQTERGAEPWSCMWFSLKVILEENNECVLFRDRLHVIVPRKALCLTHCCLAQADLRDFFPGPIGYITALKTEAYSNVCMCVCVCVILDENWDKCILGVKFNESIK